MFERINPKTLKLWLIIAALAYLLLPYDLLPDFLGLPGRIDDGLIMVWLVWFYRKHVKQFVANQFASGSSAGADANQNRRTGQGTSDTAKGPKKFDAYEILGITRSASRDAIQSAYRARMQEYHPDKVAHLGEELQELALEKSQQIQRAYVELGD
jgi:uncharacterized membrane protein YkvA (DUF1232 family)